VGCNANKRRRRERLPKKYQPEELLREETPNIAKAKFWNGCLMP
jgi:hypothetical protein